MALKRKCLLLIHLFVLSFLSLLILELLGITARFREISFHTSFDWPLYENIPVLASVLEEGTWKNTSYSDPHRLYEIENFPRDCTNHEDLVILVKSAFHFIQRRHVIRATWGNASSYPSNINIKVIFVLGQPQVHLDPGEQVLVENEILEYGDILQGSFEDEYWNNILKTLMTLEWATCSCGSASYYLFSDDDVIVSPTRLLRYLSNPPWYPDKSSSFQVDSALLKLHKDRAQIHGCVYPDNRPMRAIMDKWFISVQDYPFSQYPPYPSGGFFIMSNRALRDIYFGSHFVRQFIFDDVYIGIVAWKMGIRLTPTKYISMRRVNMKRWSDLDEFAVHLSSEADKLVSIWTHQY